MTNCYHCNDQTVTPMPVVHTETGRKEYACPECIMKQADSEEVTDDM